MILDDVKRRILEDFLWQLSDKIIAESIKNISIDIQKQPEPSDGHLNVIVQILKEKSNPVGGR